MNLSVIVALVLASNFGIAIADPLFGIAIALYILTSAWSIFSSSLHLLMDRELDEDDRAKIKAIASAHPAVISLHDLRTRSSGTQTFIQFHLELDGGLTLLEAHAISDEVMEEVERAFPRRRGPDPRGSGRRRGTSGDLQLARRITPDPAGDDQERGHCLALRRRRPSVSRQPPRRRETHASIIFLAGERAYKLKRAVRFPYLDYATAARRRLMCEAEVRINRRTAPALYRGVDRGDAGLGRPVRLRRRRRAGRLAGGNGAGSTRPPCSTPWPSGRAEPPPVEDLADAIAEFHHRAERRPEAGGGAAMAALIENNAQSFAACFRLGALDPDSGRVPPRRLAPSARRPPHAARSAPRGGKVRHCHGDLHLGNIVLYEGRPTLFDAIEFNDAFAEIDVLYDLAFLLMDLAHRGRADLAGVVFNRYSTPTGDSGGLALSAAVRLAARRHPRPCRGGRGAGPVRSDEAAGASPAPAGTFGRIRGPATDSARLVAIGGLSGTGKSSLARALGAELAERPGARVLRTDCIRKRLAGVALEARLDADGYTAEMTRKTYGALVEDAGEVLAAGRPVIADGVFASARERDAMRELARRLRVPFFGLWLDAPAAALEARVGARRGGTFPTQGPMSFGCSLALLSAKSTGPRWMQRGRQKRRRRRPGGRCRRAHPARRTMRDPRFARAHAHAHASV